MPPFDFSNFFSYVADPDRLAPRDALNDRSHNRRHRRHRSADNERWHRSSSRDPGYRSDDAHRRRDERSQDRHRERPRWNWSDNVSRRELHREKGIKLPLKDEPCAKRPSHNHTPGEHQLDSEDDDNITTYNYPRYARLSSHGHHEKDYITRVQRPIISLNDRRHQDDTELFPHDNLVRRKVVSKRREYGEHVFDDKSFPQLERDRERDRKIYKKVQSEPEEYHRPREHSQRVRRHSISPLAPNNDMDNGIHAKSPRLSVAQRPSDLARSLSDAVIPSHSSPQIRGSLARPTSGSASTVISAPTMAAVRSSVLGAKTYQYQPLGEMEIRFVKILPEKMFKLRCEILHASIDDTPEYVAISVRTRFHNGAQRRTLTYILLPVRMG
jgi:hypothetical protein